MVQFHTRQFDAPNVFEVDVDPAIVAEFEPLVDARPSGEFFETSPTWSGDIRWVSPNTIRAFRWFQSRFLRLGVGNKVRPLLDLDEGVRMYAGFLVIRTWCEEPDPHVDWKGTNHQAFTLLTPVTAGIEDFGLQYERLDGSVGEYAYRPGKAIVLGDEFVHWTKPGRSDRPVALLSFTFGTDRMEHWPAISPTASKQANLVRRPDGCFFVHDVDGPLTD